MPTVLQLTEQRNGVWERMKEINDRVQKGETLSAEDEANWQAADAEIGNIDKRISMQVRMEGMSAHNPTTPTNEGPLAGGARGEVPPDGPGWEPIQRSAEYRKTFLKWARSGPNILTLEEHQLLAQGFRSPDGGNYERRDEVTNIATLGGFLIPEGFVRQIESAMLAFGGMRAVASGITTDNGADLPWPISDDTGNEGEILNEAQAASEQNVTFGRVVFKAHMYSSKIIQVSYQLMQDSAFDLEGFLAARMAERVARIQNRHFTVGLGMNEPMGIVTTCPSGIAAAGTTAVTFDEVLNLEHAVDPAYRNGAQWMFADATLLALKKIKDGEGRYIWVPGGPVNNGGPATLWGYPYEINQAVPTMASGNKAILFGQFSKYMIRDVRGFTLMRLNERSAASLLVDFLGFARADGGLLDAGTHPVQCITMA